MAVTNEQILGFLNANPGISDAEIVAAMEAYGVSPAQMAKAVGVSEGEVAARVAATVPQGQSVTLGDTIVQPQYQVTGSGEDQQVGGIENVYTYKVGENKTGGGYQQYNPDGTLARTGTQQAVSNSLTPFILGSLGLFGGLGGGFESLFGGGAGATGAGSTFEALNAGAGAGADYLGGSLANVGAASTIGNTGMTLSELTQLNMALGGTGGTLGALTLAEQLGGLAAGTLTGAAVSNLGGTTGMGGGTGLLAGAGGLGLSTTGAGLGAAGTGAGLTGGALTGTGLGTGSVLSGLTTGVGTGVGAGVGSTLAGVGTALGTGLTAGATGLGGLTAAQLGALLSGGLTLGGGLMQSQTSKDAAIKAQAKIDAETAAAKQAAAFRPVGMTTRFGTSQFQVDPVTGQLTSAGYTLSPEAKYAQDKLAAQANIGLQQIEQAQGQFAPLQTGAQSLFTLGNKYLAQTPEDVAKNYLAQQMALLQPGRELELANLQNKLQQQGRAGLSVAQGGALGATTPELQALYNARAMQEAQLAAQAQQAGQQQVQFGAGLLGTGAQTLGQYYAGQQAAYAPYTTALGQVQALEAAGQQPFTMSTNLAQQTAQAGANVGKLGLTGAGQSVELATGQAATNNPYASFLSGLGASPTFGTAAGNVIGGLFA
jgi:hypothetical protein